MPSAHLVCLLLALTLSATSAQDGYEVFPSVPDSRYKLNTLHLTWPEALSVCQGDGGGSHLVIINSQEEAEVVKELFARITDPTVRFLAVGIDDIVTEGTWVTVQGSLVSTSGYNVWLPGEPNNQDGDENCGCILRDGSYNDDQCNLLKPFVCEKPNV